MELAGIQFESKMRNSMQPRPLTPQEKDAMMYARTGKVEQLRELISRGGIPASWTSPDATSSLLTLAARHGQLEMIRYLLSEGANPNWVGGDGCALDEAAIWTRKEAILFLREVTLPSVVQHSAESLKQILRPVLEEGNPLDGWRVTDAGGARRLEFNEAPSADSPVSCPAQFWDYGTVVDFGGEILPVSYVDYGRIRIEAAGFDLGALSITEKPLHFSLEPGLYALSGLEPSAFISRYDCPGCSILDQRFLRVFLLQSQVPDSDWFCWGKPQDILVSRKIVGLMAGGVWQLLLDFAQKDERFWDYLFYSATGTCTNIWSPVGVEINSFDEGNALVFEASEHCRIWAGHSTLGSVTSLIIVCW